MKILVTGANGFVGRALIPYLVNCGHTVVASTRNKTDVGHNIQNVAVGAIGPETDWRAGLHGCDTVVHLAGRAHIMEEGGETAALYFRVNVEGSRQLFSQALEAGVASFLYASSIKAAGEFSRPPIPLAEKSLCQPEDDYGKSKLQAEKELTSLTNEQDIKLTILRFPLVYGPGVAANMGKLLEAVRRGRPAPDVMPKNQRSFIYVGNLVSAIETAIAQRRGGLYHLSDGIDFSTGELAEELAEALGTSPLLIPAPVPLLKLAGWIGDLIPGSPLNSRMVSRLTGSLQVDSHHFRRTFDWTPPYRPAEGFREMVKIA